MAYTIGTLQRARPSSSQVHQNTILQNHAVTYQQDISSMAYINAPRKYGAQYRSDDFGVIPAGDLLRPQARKRADGAAPHKIEWSTDKISFNCDVWAIAADIDDQTERNADAWIRTQETVTEIVMQQIALQQEKDFISTAFTANNFEAGSQGNGLWSVNTSSLRADVEKMIDQIYDDTGLVADSWMMGRDVWRAITKHPEVDDLVVALYTGTREVPSTEVLRRAVAAHFELDNIFVTNSRQNTAQEGQDDSFSQIAAKQSLIFHRGAGTTVGERQPTAIVHVTWDGYAATGEDGINILEYESKETVHARTIEAEAAYTFLIENSHLGRLVTAAVA